MLNRTRLFQQVRLTAAVFIAGASILAFAPKAIAEPMVKTAYVETGGSRYAYRTFGSPTGTPVVLITRYRANMDDWDPAFIEALAKERRVIVFNQSGVASSAGDARQTIPDMAADVAEFIQAMDLQKVDVLGWSMGGFTAQALVADHPDLVRRVILIGTGPAASPATPGPKEGVFDVATKPGRDDGVTIYSDADRGYLFFAEGTHSQDLAKASLARIDAARSNDEPLTTQAAMEAQTAAIQAWWFDASSDYFDRMRSVKNPVLIINGDSDAFFSNTAQALMSETYPNASLAIIPNAGHGPQHQHPSEIAKLVDRFLD
ncbi:MAG: alpha/beta hydrolase [Pseudomonadota bacterium]